MVLPLLQALRIDADQQQGNVSFSTLEEAFGPDSLGILIVKDVPSEFITLRHRLLSYSSYLGNLSADKLGQSNTCCFSKYLTRGRED
jgi:hypothetical protein